MAAVSPGARVVGGVAPLGPPAGSAFADLYDRHSSRVFGYCLKWLRSREEAEDATQTAFLHAWRGLERGVVPTVEIAWLLAIARNVCRNRTDAARRRSCETVQDPHVLADTVPAPAAADGLGGLPEALAGLTEAQRRAIVMREWHGLSYKEIAHELDLSQSAVETLLFRARRSLARNLRKPFGGGSLAPWLKSLLGGGAAKVTLGAAVVAVTVTAGAVEATHSHPRVARPAARPPGAVTPALRTVRPSHGSRVSPSRSPKRPVVSAGASVPASRATPTPTSTPTAETSTPPQAPPVVAANGVERAAVTPANVTPPAPGSVLPAAPPPADVVSTATDDVQNVVQTVTQSVTTATAPVTQPVAAAVSQVQAAVTAATAPILPPLPTLTPPGLPKLPKLLP